MNVVRKKTLENTDLSQFRGEWIAYKPTTKEIVGSGASLKIVKEVVSKKGVRQYIIMEIPKSGIPFAGYTIAK